MCKELFLKGHLCRTEIIDLHNPKLHHREKEREADGFSSEHLYDDLLCMCALVQLGRRFATCPALLLAVAIFMNPLDARGMGTGALLWSLLLRH